MSSALIVLSGPPLPGRWSLARAVEKRCCVCRFVAEPGSVPHLDILRALEREQGHVLVDGNLATAMARAEVLGLADEGVERLLVEWRCTREEAEREVFHRYASRPRVLASAELERYLDDARLREAIAADERAGGVVVVSVGPELPLDQQVDRVVGALRSAPPLRAERGPGEREQRRIMVVEDDPEERTLLAEVLLELGFEVELAPDAGVALALLAEGVKVDLLISDQQMPGMTGVELTREVMLRHAGVRTVLLTAYSDEEMCRKAVEASAVTVLAKPLRVIDLERVLEEAA